MTDDTGRMVHEPEDRMVHMPADFEPPRHWWQNPRWLAALAALIFTVGNAGWALTSLETSRTVKQQQQPLDTIRDAVTGPLSGANEKLDSIIAYINAQQAKADQNAAALSVAIQDLNQVRDLICQSSDPIREFVCALTPIPTPHVTPSPQPAIPTTTTTTQPPATTAPPAATTTTTTCPALPNGKCRH